MSYEREGCMSSIAFNGSGKKNVTGAVYLVLLFILSSCASEYKGSDGGRFFDSAYNDHNRAPETLSPKITSKDGGDKLDPVYMRTQADYYFSLGENFSLDGKHDKAVENFKMVQIYDADSATVCFRLAAEYIKLGLISEAMEQAERGVAKDPKNIEGHILLSGLYSTIKEYPKAIEEYEKALKIDPNNPEANLFLAAVYAEQKMYDKSIRYFEKLIENEDYATPHLAYYYIGRVRMDQDTPASLRAAEAALKKSLKTKPGYVESVMTLGSLYSRQGKEEKALELYKTFQKEQGPNARVAEILAQNYLEKEQYDQAYAQLEVLENGAESALDVKVRMALILIEQKKYNKAIAKLTEILKEAPESDKIQFYLAAIYEETSQKAKAIESFSKIPSQSPFYSEAVVHSSYLLRGEKKIDEALSVVENAFKVRKDIPQFYAVYASILDEKKEFKKAHEILQQGIEKFPDQVQLKFFMGTIEDRMGNKGQVVEQMKKVVEIDPNHVQGLNYLAFTYADMGTNLGEAEELVRRALQIEPNDGYILDTLGWILYKENKMAESIRVLEKAYKSQPNESVIAEHLGDVYNSTQFADKAKVMYEKAAEFETEDDKLRVIRAKITSIESQENVVRQPASAPDSK
jgi:tetratricopeptide (TPR) repeat protein